MFDTLKPVIILVNPQLGENIGMSARAMFNCGLVDLRLVTPRDGWPNDRAMATSAECLKLMPEVQVFSSLKQATADIQYLYASTARPRYIQMDVMTPSQAGRDMAQRCTNKEKVGIVFGGESSGLDNEDITHCNMIVTAPLNPDFTSLNLAQAVLLLSWEWRKYSTENMVPETVVLDSPIASRTHTNVALDKLEKALDERGFFKSETSGPIVKRNLRTMFNRISMNEQEVRMLHGIIRTLCDFSVKK